jgi:hypothetical protein
MMAPSPRDFPILFPLRVWRRIHPTRPCRACPVCHLVTDPRNAERHRKACAKRKRDAPELWAEWRADMRQP